jgi:hypothetical protein
MGRTVDDHYISVLRITLQSSTDFWRRQITWRTRADGYEFFIYHMDKGKIFFKLPYPVLNTRSLISQDFSNFFFPRYFSIREWKFSRRCTYEVFNWINTYHHPSFAFLVKQFQHLIAKNTTQGTISLFFCIILHVLTLSDDGRQRYTLWCVWRQLGLEIKLKREYQYQDGKKMAPIRIPIILLFSWHDICC